MKGFKTVAFNVVMTLIALVKVFNPDAELPDTVAVQASVDLVDAGFLSAWGTINLILRSLTDSPIFKKV